MNRFFIGMSFNNYYSSLQDIDEQIYTEKQTKNN